MNTKTIIKIIITIVCMLCINGAVGASTTFGAEATVCIPSWYCTAYSSENCGTRTCVDTNVCGTNMNKPAESLQCTESPSGEESKSSSGSLSGSPAGFTLNNLVPDGYFTTDTDVITMTVNQETLSQKIIKINATKQGIYNLEIKYPASYISGSEFVTTSSNNKSIEYKGDFNIIVDARNVLAGTYIIPIVISNGLYSKSIELLIEVTSKDSPNIEIHTDSKIKIINIDSNIIANIKTKGIQLWTGENITFTITDPKGNILLAADRTIVDPANIEETIALPPNMSEGYYTLNINIHAIEKDYTKSSVFTVFAPNKYSPALESPQKSKVGKNIVWIIIIVVIAALIIFNSVSPDKPGRRRIGKKVSWTQAHDEQAFDKYKFQCS
jgi:hypothetical protein